MNNPGIFPQGWVNTNLSPVYCRYYAAPKRRSPERKLLLIIAQWFQPCVLEYYESGILLRRWKHVNGGMCARGWEERRQGGKLIHYTRMLCVYTSRKYTSTRTSEILIELPSAPSSGSGPAFTCSDDFSHSATPYTSAKVPWTPPEKFYWSYNMFSKVFTTII